MYILEGLDVIIRRTVKDIIGLPDRTSTAMFYAPRKLRGLGLLNCQWEAPLQHISIALKIRNYDDPRFLHVFNFEEEVRESVSRLNLPENKKTPLINSVQLRRELRQHSYEEWASLSWQGIGVMHFEECKFANNFMVDKIHLSSSEWTSILKLNVNYANLRGVPGNNLEKKWFFPL